MTQGEKKTVRKSSLDTLIDRLDEMYIKNGWKVPEWAEPDPTRNDSEDARAEASLTRLVSYALKSLGERIHKSLTSLYLMKFFTP